jgi:hypothetical protein
MILDGKLLNFLNVLTVWKSAYFWYEKNEIKIAQGNLGRGRSPGLE